MFVTVKYFLIPLPRYGFLWLLHKTARLFMVCLRNTGCCLLQNTFSFQFLS